MKQLVVLITIISMISLENGMASILTPAVAQMPHVIKNVRVHGKKPKLKLKSTLAIRPASSEDTLVVDDNIVFGRNRNKIALVTEDKKELSDYVKIRLMLARMKALDAYKEKWGC